MTGDDDRPAGRDEDRPLSRRRYLRAAVGGVGAAASAGLAGCSGIFETQSVGGEPPLVEDRPDAVYVPTHREGMEMVGRAEAGRLRLALSYSFPHRFWLIDGDDLTQVDVRSEDTVHLMLSVWDAETGMVIPASNTSLTVTKEGEQVARISSLWRMLSQNMGVHFGDNVALDGDGTYEVAVAYGPVGTRRTGVFRDAFSERVERTFTMEFSQSDLEEQVSYEDLSDRQGERDAVEPMSMEMMPVPQVRSPDAMPGSLGAQGSAGDATFVVRVLDQRPEGIEGSGPYLYVSPRTPYNSFPIPNFSLDATVARDGETVFEGALTATLSPTLDHHYGAPIESAEAGDDVTVTPLLPPQISRHEGYETAFMEFSPLELTLESR